MQFFYSILAWVIKVLVSKLAYCFWTKPCKWPWFRLSSIYITCPHGWFVEVSAEPFKMQFAHMVFGEQCQLWDREADLTRVVKYVRGSKKLSLPLDWRELIPKTLPFWRVVPEDPCSSNLGFLVNSFETIATGTLFNSLGATSWSSLLSRYVIARDLGLLQIHLHRGWLNRKLKFACQVRPWRITCACMNMTYVQVFPQFLLLQDTIWMGSNSWFLGSWISFPFGLHIYSEPGSINHEYMAH